MQQRFVEENWAHFVDRREIHEHVAEWIGKTHMDIQYGSVQFKTSA